MQRIGVLFNPLSEQSKAISQEVAEWLRLRGCDVWQGVSAGARGDPPIPDDLELLVALGGDGTVLRAARLAIEHGSIPVLPVALGHLNFMADIGPDEVYQGLELLMDGGGWHDERTLLDATIYHHEQGGAPSQHLLALNEILVARGEINRVILVDVEIYGAHMTSYHADGVILATATGSTAYALAAGGPIIDPRSRALVLVPVAAHLASLPSLVLAEDAVVTLKVRSRHQAALSADGRMPLALHEGDEVMVQRARQVCVFARVRPQHEFYSRMTQRLRRNP
jgi:NAD+ kinase